MASNVRDVRAGGAERRMRLARRPHSSDSSWLSGSISLSILVEPIQRLNDSSAGSCTSDKNRPAFGCVRGQVVDSEKCVMQGIVRSGTKGKKSGGASLKETEKEVRLGQAVSHANASGWKFAEPRVRVVSVG